MLAAIDSLVMFLRLENGNPEICVSEAGMGVFEVGSIC